MKNSNVASAATYTPTASSSPACEAMSAPAQLVQSPSSSGPTTITYQQVGDLQPSGSSNSYVSIQSPSGVSLATNQPYQSGPIVVAPQQQQPQQQSSRQQPLQVQVAANQVTDQNVKQQQQQQQARFGRSSASVAPTNSKQQQQQQANGNLPLSHYSQYSTSTD